MEHISTLKMHGSMTAILEKEDGDVSVTRKDNIIVDNGFDFVCHALANAGARPACLSHIAIGTSTTAPDAANTTLLAEVARVAATYAHTNGTKQFTMTAVFEAGTGTAAITEAGVFNDAAANTGAMLDRVTFAVINKGAADKLTVIFTFELS